MSIKNRIREIEKKTGVRKEPVFLIVTYYRQEEPTEQAKEKAEKGAVEKNPRQDMYVLDFCDKNLPPLGHQTPQN